jgi:predicted DCC family thiol-disulfide oxidoreductase YuxK
MKIGWRERWREVLSLDLRTLALFRFALGATLAVDMLNRLAHVRTFYTDWGLWPREAAMDYAGPMRLSVHLLNGDTWFAATLLLIEAAAGVALALGWRTRAATVVAFVLQASLLNRNSVILLGGDTLLTCLLFWGMFLPLGARWSLDVALAQNRPPEEPRHLSPAGVALLAQVLIVYFFSAILKNGAEWWPDGTAVYYTMMLDRYSTPLGRVLLDYPRLMQGLTYYVYFLELLGPLLALSPFLQRPLRFLVMLGLMAMHIGFVVCMEIGLFPWVSLTSLTVLLGGWFWDWAERRADRGHTIRVYYDRDCAFCLKSCHLLRTMLVLPRCDILPAQDSVRAHALMQAHYSWVVIDAYDVAHTKWSAFVALLRHSLLFRWLAPLAEWKVWDRPGNAVYDWVARHRGRFGQVTGALLPVRAVAFEVPAWAQKVAGAYIAIILVWNVVTIDRLPMAVAHALEPVVLPLRIDQGWPMFAPRPWQDDGWYIVPATLEDGTEIDLRTGRAVDWNKPARVEDTEADVRWRTYHTMYWHRHMANYRQYYAQWLCRDWNVDAADGRHVLTLRVIYMLEQTPPPGRLPKVEQRVMWRHSCLASDALPSGREPQRDEPVKEQHKRPV